MVNLLFLLMTLLGYVLWLCLLLDIFDTLFDNENTYVVNYDYSS